MISLSKPKVVFLISILTLTMLVIFIQEAQAFVYDGCKWPTNTMYYDKHTLFSGWESAVSYGRNQWNNVTPSPFTILKDDTSGNDVTLGTVPPGFAAVTARNCPPGTTITYARITFNSSFSWYTGGQDPGGLWDARSVATHEFGHAIGLGHTQSQFCPANDDLKATMCNGYSAGKTYKRTLAPDDLNGINYVYP